MTRAARLVSVPLVWVRWAEFACRSAACAALTGVRSVRRRVGWTSVSGEGARSARLSFAPPGSRGEAQQPHALGVRQVRRIRPRTRSGQAPPGKRTHPMRTRVDHPYAPIRDDERHKRGCRGRCGKPAQARLAEQGRLQTESRASGIMELRTIKPSYKLESHAKKIINWLLSSETIYLPRKNQWNSSDCAPTARMEISSQCFHIQQGN